MSLTRGVPPTPRRRYGYRIVDWQVATRKGAEYRDRGFQRQVKGIDHFQRQADAIYSEPADKSPRYLILCDVPSPDVRWHAAALYSAPKTYDELLAIMSL